MSIAVQEIRLSLDQCRRLAASAEVTASFIAWPDAVQDPDFRQFTETFEEAYDIAMGTTCGAMRILFQWQVGEKAGYGETEYSVLSFPTASRHFVRQMARNRINEQIAQKLHQNDYWPAPADRMENWRDSGLN